MAADGISRTRSSGDCYSDKSIVVDRRVVGISRRCFDNLFEGHGGKRCAHDQFVRADRTFSPF